jgi:predicted small secreted protein
MTARLIVMFLALQAAATPSPNATQGVGTDVVSILASGLIGAVIGAVLASATSLLLQRNDRLHEQHSAARLIVIELIHTQNILVACQRTKLWTQNQLSRSFWESQGAKVSAALKPEGLVTVGRPYLYVQSLEAVAATYVLMKNPRGMFHGPQTNPQDDIALLDDAVAACSKAIEFLRTYAGFSDEEFARLQEAASK